MPTAADLLRQHFETLVADNAQWQALIAEDLVWELVYAPTLGHPARMLGREEAALSGYSGNELRLATMRAVPSATPPSCTARSAMSST
jgi:ketosteroid isomerase-like protein